MNQRSFRKNQIFKNLLNLDFKLLSCNDFENFGCDFLILRKLIKNITKSKISYLMLTSSNMGLYFAPQCEK